MFTPLTEGRSARDLTQAATSQKKKKPVHSSMSDIDPVASFVRQRFVLAPFEEEGEAALLVSVILNYCPSSPSQR